MKEFLYTVEIPLISVAVGKGSSFGLHMATLEVDKACIMGYLHFDYYLRDSSNAVLEQSKWKLLFLPPLHIGAMSTNPAEVAEFLADHFASVSK